MHGVTISKSTRQYFFHHLRFPLSHRIMLSNRPQGIEHTLSCSKCSTPKFSQHLNLTDCDGVNHIQFKVEDDGAFLQTDTLQYSGGDCIRVGSLIHTLLHDGGSHHRRLCVLPHETSDGHRHHEPVSVVNRDLVMADLDVEHVGSLIRPRRLVNLHDH